METRKIDTSELFPYLASCQKWQLPRREPPSLSATGMRRLDMEWLYAANN
jgi:hypothetical protein